LEVESDISNHQLSHKHLSLDRFPFTAFENGGATFIFVYIIILFLIGKPFYFLEMIIGQFTSSGSLKALAVIPLMKGLCVASTGHKKSNIKFTHKESRFLGLAFGQQIASATITSYYSSIISLTLFYLIQSFSRTLPWTQCPERYDSPCVPSNINQEFNNASRSSTEIYF
jgi:solute carrier family 6 amino acid transporter-like protein 5/7/9/14